MEKKLRNIFDYQRFERSIALSELIKETESRMSEVLSDDALAEVYAAGDGPEEKTADDPLRK